jgi:hypothetical protein
LELAVVSFGYGVLGVGNEYGWPRVVTTLMNRFLISSEKLNDEN